MYIWLALALLFALLEVVAVSKNLPKLEYLAKPAVMVSLFLWLYLRTGLQGNTLWFGLGIVFSLLGDVLLITSLDRMFLFGLTAFLFAHIFYITGLWQELQMISAWSFVLAAFIAINVGRLLRRIIGEMRAKGENKLVIPAIGYGTVISAMLYTAMSTIYDPNWKTSAAFFVSAGALLFYISDVVLAWMKFVAPIKNGKIWSIALYQLGQIGLIAGVVSQFGVK